MNIYDEMILSSLYYMDTMLFYDDDEDVLKKLRQKIPKLRLQEVNGSKELSP